MKKKMMMYIAVCMVLCGLTACGRTEQSEVRDSLVSSAAEGTEEQTEETDSQSVEETDTAEPEKERTFPEPVYGDTRGMPFWI